MLIKYLTRAARSARAALRGAGRAALIYKHKADARHHRERQRGKRAGPRRHAAAALLLVGLFHRTGSRGNATTAGADTAARLCSNRPGTAARASQASQTVHTRCAVVGGVFFYKKKNTSIWPNSSQIRLVHERKSEPVAAQKARSSSAAWCSPRRRCARRCRRGARAEPPPPPRSARCPATRASGEPTGCVATPRPVRRRRRVVAPAPRARAHAHPQSPPAPRRWAWTTGASGA